MRKSLAVLLAGIFLVLFFIAVTVNQFVDTATDPGVITGMLDDAEMYDYIYDNIIGNVVYDMVENGIEVNTGLDEESAPTILNFEDTDAASAALVGLIKTLVPREYVKAKIEESLNGIVPYATGDTDEFTVDLEVQKRVRLVPGAARKIVTDLELTERVIADILVPQFGSFSEQISGQGLGISFTKDEIETNARLIFEPVWLEGHLFGAIDEITPYFVGDADSFNVSVRFDDRLVVMGEILKNKLGNSDTLYNLVFVQVVDPLIEQAVAHSTTVGFGISLTEQEVAKTFEIIAPRPWVVEQGEGVIDEMIDYLIGNTDRLGYTIGLSDRKTAAITALQSLARSKLEETLTDIPACTTPLELLGAAQDISSKQLPRCIAGGRTTIDTALMTLAPVMDAQVNLFINEQVPDEVTYSQEEFAAQIGGSFDTVLDIRERIAAGISFSDQDLIELMAGDSSAASLDDAESNLKILADGLSFTEENITENLTPEAQQQFDVIRAYVGTGLSLRWLLWVLVLIPLVVIAFIVGGRWADRLKWAGGVAVICALIVYGGISLAGSFNGIAQEYVADYGAQVSDEFKADYPRLAAEIESGELEERFERMLDSWQSNWRNQTVPWVIAGAVAFLAGLVLQRTSGSKGVKFGGGPSYSGSSASAAPSPTFTVPKEWGDEDDAENASSGSATDSFADPDEPIVTNDSEDDPKSS